MGLWSKVRSLVVAASMMSGDVGATDIWVSGTGSDDLGIGSEENPYRTITFALSNAPPSGAVVIKVKAGTYTKAVGEVFPLSRPNQTGLTDDITIAGQVSIEANYPQIGGDLNDSSSSTEAVFLIDATTTNRVGIEVRNVRVVGEDYSGEDAPSALLVRTAGSKFTARCVFDGVIVGRLAQNEVSQPQLNGRAPILLIGGYGSLSMVIKNCVVEANERGGIEARVGPSANSEGTPATIVARFDNCTVQTSATEESAFGIQVQGEGDVFAEITPVIQDCTIDSSGAGTGGGILDGIVIAAIAGDDASIEFPTEETIIDRNLVKACLETGLTLRVQATTSTSSSARVSRPQVFRNALRGNGTGFLMDWGAEAASSRTLNLETQGNLIVDNGVGVRMANDGDDEDIGYWLWSVNDTIANNASYGVSGPDTPLAFWPTFVNAIVYYNNGNGVQHYGPVADWHPEDAIGAYYGVNNSCWQGLSGGDPNSTGASPKFVNLMAGDYHLSCDESPSVDSGDNTPFVEEFIRADIDGEDRTQPGETGVSSIVDMGADELTTDSCEEA